VVPWNRPRGDASRSDEDVGLGEIARFVDAVFDAFFFQAAKEFGDRVVPAVVLCQ